MLNWICRRLELWTDRDTKGLLALDIAEFPSFSVPSASYHILWENDNRFINTANLFRVAQGKGSRDDESRVNVCFVKKDTKSSSNTSVLGILFLWNGHYPATVPDFPNPCWINFLLFFRFFPAMSVQCRFFIWLGFVIYLGLRMHQFQKYHLLRLFWSRYVVCLV